MVDILLRRRQNNPLLTGDAGVGKTAIVEGLALAIAAGSMPPALSQVSLLSLDIVALSAGASMKGEFEARLKSVLMKQSRQKSPLFCLSMKYTHLLARVAMPGPAMRRTY